MLQGRMAGVVAHPLDDVLGKIDRLCGGDPEVQFGMRGLSGLEAWDVLQLVAQAAGFVPEETARSGPVWVDPERVLEACRDVGERLSVAASRKERVLLATGHPKTLALLYALVGEVLEGEGAILLRPLEGASWKEGMRERGIRYVQGVAVMVENGSPRHTHDAGPMARMLEEASPDVVFADHGFAGAAIQAGIDTVSIADVNDPALVVARALGRCGPVVVMDDGVPPEAYWPCFQAITYDFH